VAAVGTPHDGIAETLPLGAAVETDFELRPGRLSLARYLTAMFVAARARGDEPAAGPAGESGARAVHDAVPVLRVAA